MEEYEFTAILEYSMIIKAENIYEAKRIIDKYSAEGWIRNAELIGLFDVELVNETDLPQSANKRS